MAIATSGAVPIARSELRTRSSLLLEAIALRHQIAVLERSRTRRPCFRRFDRLLWILLSRFWPQWRESLMIVQPETVLRWRRDGWSAIWRYRSRGHWRGGRPKVSREVRGLITRMARENFLWGGSTDSWRASHARFQGLPSHRIALSARTKQTADTVVAELSSQSSHRLRPPPVSRGAFRHGVPGPAVLSLLGQPDAIGGADREVKRGTLSLACSPNPDADRSKNSPASRPARTRRYAPCPTVGHRVWPLMEGTRQSFSDRRSDAKSAV